MSFSALSQKSLATSKTYIQTIKENNEFWKGSPFDWMRCLPSRTRGKIGQDLAKSVFVEYGYQFTKRRNSFEVNGANVISRTSMVWASDVWKFQQLRNTEFDYVFCLGLYPDSASAWLIPKPELYDGGEIQEKDGWEPQHGGRSGREDAWLRIPPDAAPKWLSPFGGSIERIPKVLKKFLG